MAESRHAYQEERKDVDTKQENNIWERCRRWAYKKTVWFKSRTLKVKNARTSKGKQGRQKQMLNIEVMKNKE